MRDLMCQSDVLPVVCSQFTGKSWKESDTKTWNQLDADNYLGYSSPRQDISYANGAANTKPHCYRWDITDIAKNWVGNTDYQDKGVIFKAGSTVFEKTSQYANRMKTFSSMQGNASYKPYFYISYTIPTTGISISKSSLALNVGETDRLSATIKPINATNKTVTWTSSNTTVATVSSNGTVTAKAAGIAVITVKSKANSAVAAKCTVTVKIPDSDGDGLNDTIEKQLGTNPYSKDTDGD